MDELSDDAIVYLNGKFMPLSSAQIHVLDRGFIFGDGIYEVLVVYKGKIFRLAEHLQRLNQSLQDISMSPVMSDPAWQTLLQTLLAKNAGQDMSIYIQITRGAAKREHFMPETPTPTVFAMCNPLPTHTHSTGVTAMTHADIRWAYCHIKAITLLPNVMLRQLAKQAGFYEAILIRDGMLTEGAASNVFIVTDQIIKTPPKGAGILPGITRDVVIEILAQHKLPYQETPITSAELKQADEIWLTSSTHEILPVIKLDQQPIGNGQPGEHWQKINVLYQDFKTSLRA